MLADWLVPRWPVPSHVRAVCTTRSGGRSKGPYDSMNLGAHVGDHVLDVAANRSILHQATQAKPVYMAQVHGSQVALLDAHTPQGAQGDGCVTHRSGVACTMLVADCLPVLLCDDEGSIVGAAHAGWRGLAGQRGSGILEATVKVMLEKAPHDLKASRLVAWLGPCIGPSQFEVGDDVYRAFVGGQAAAQALFKPQGAGKWLADLQGLARQRLARLGITHIHGNDGSAAWCTVSNPSRFFSHRRDRGVSGRMAACIWLK